MQPMPSPGMGSLAERDASLSSFSFSISKLQAIVPLDYLGGDLTFCLQTAGPRTESSGSPNNKSPVRHRVILLFKVVLIYYY